MIYGVDNFTVEYSPVYSVTFVRAGNTLGWHTSLNGNRYGDVVTLNDGFAEDELVETFILLASQALSSLEKLGATCDFMRFKEQMVEAIKEKAA